MKRGLNLLLCGPPESGLAEFVTLASRRFEGEEVSRHRMSGLEVLATSFVCPQPEPEQAPEEGGQGVPVPVALRCLPGMPDHEALLALFVQSAEVILFSAPLRRSLVEGVRLQLGTIGRQLMRAGHPPEQFPLILQYQAEGADLSPEEMDRLLGVDRTGLTRLTIGLQDGDQFSGLSAAIARGWRQRASSSEPEVLS
ncbi:MAG: hypothetical protein Q7Q71_04965 [Verrucomicrobiota bacterium JB023]|nr:hypothetical protein [Verrucomicrobiota bacterium JB023]